MTKNTTRTLVLRLQGPIQAWGRDDSLLGRTTGLFPSRSAIWGLLFNAAGRFGPQKEALARAADYPVTVIGAQPLVQPVMSDFQTIGAGYDEADPWEAMMIPHKADGTRCSVTKGTGATGAKILVREYLCDVSFYALVTIPADWEDEIVGGLRTPVGIPYLGRKCCAPSAPIFVGIEDDEEKARSLLFAVAASEGKTPAYEVRETNRCEPGSEVVCDVPVEFGPNRKWRPRSVTVTSVVR